MGGRARASKSRAPEQLGLVFPVRHGWGGKRVGAGRPRKDPALRVDVSHAVRPALAARHPVHVTVRVVEAVRGLRRRAGYHAIRWAVQRCALRGDFRIVHLSIQHSHIHLIVEAADKSALARGMQAFQISAARRLNRAVGELRAVATTRRQRGGSGRGAQAGAARAQPATARRGTVFPHRYHATVLRTPTQTRHAIAYVLNNWRKHWSQIPPAQRALWIDPFSSAYAFRGWAEYGDAVFLWPRPPTYDPLLTCRPHTWLLSEGYLRGGPPISLTEQPGGAVPGPTADAGRAR